MWLLSGSEKSASRTTPGMSMVGPSKTTPRFSSSARAPSMSTTEMLIERAVDRLLEGRTGVIIAHRLATVDRADDILILEDGRTVEFGERTSLAADPESRFSHLLTAGIEELLA